MRTEQEKFDKGDSEKQYIERSDEKLGLLELLISAVKDAIDAIQDFHQNPFIRLAENEFGIHPYSLLYWWSLKKMEPQKYKKYITLLKLQGQDTYVIEAVVADYDRKRTELKCGKIGLKAI